MSGNTVFIPGATSGIGLALALALRERGNTVIIGGRRQELLDRISSEHPDVSAVRIDTADPHSITAVAEHLIATHPDLNVLITMAGVMRIEDWHGPNDFLASAESTITTNVLGPIRLIAAFVAHLQAQPASTVVTVSSELAFISLRITPSYNASKAAIHMLTESLRLQFHGSTVEFKELQPPSVKTDLLPGQRDSDFAMPLEEFITEVIDILDADPDVREIQVDNVKLLRYPEARGDFAETVALINNADPHGK